MAYAQAVPLTAMFLTFVCKALRRLVAFFATLLIHRTTRKMEQFS